MGASLSGPGSRASHEADKSSSPKASIPSADPLDAAPIGSIVWHCSEEDGGPDVGYSIKLGDASMLWCGEITSKTYYENDCESYATELGWWLIFYDGDLTRVIAKCFDQDAALDALDRLSSLILSNKPATSLSGDNNDLVAKLPQSPAPPNASAIEARRADTPKSESVEDESAPGRPISSEHHQREGSSNG